MVSIDTEEKDLEPSSKPLGINKNHLPHYPRFIIPLMDPDQAFDYTKEVMPVLKREFANREEEMKKIVLMVVK